MTTSSNATITGPDSMADAAIKKTICGICSAACGVDAYVKEGRLEKIEGTPENPASRGVLCAKGRSNLEYVYHRERIRTPLLRRGERGGANFVAISWDEAFDRIADRLNGIKQDFGPESVVFFTGYPKWLRPFLKRLAHGFGSPNYCSESSTCFLATILANQLNYGFPGWPDIKNAKCILNWSSNPHHSSVQRLWGLKEARKNGVKIIEVGPLQTPLAAHADIHLRIRPGTSGALALSMAHVIITEDLYDREFVENWTVGFESFRDYVAGFAPRTAERMTGVPAEDIAAAARLYAATKPATMFNSACVTVHHTNGVQNHRAITALIGLTGNFDRPGGNHVIPLTYYLSPTGLVSREHEFEQVRSWDEMPPRIGAQKFPVWAALIPEAQSTEVPFQIRSRKPYPITSMLAFGLNHRMWPGSDFMKESLQRLDFLVDVDLFMTDSAKLADIVLPACSSFEREELKIYSSRYAIYAQPVITPLGESRSDVDIIVELSKRLNPADTLLAEGYEAGLDWMFAPSDIRMTDIKDPVGGGYLKDRTPTPYEKYRQTGFDTPSGKMEFSSSILAEAGIDPLPVYREPGLSPVATPGIAAKFPLILTVGARLPKLMHSRMYRIDSARKSRPEPAVDIHPQDALHRGIYAGDWVTLATPRGSIRVRANLTERVPPGVASIYHGDPKGDANELIDPDYRDPISGYPGYKSLLCEITGVKDPAHT